MTLHTLTASERAALRQFYMPPLPEGWAGVFVREDHLHTGLPMRVLFRLGLIEIYGDLTPRGATFRLTETGVQVRELLDRGETDIAVGEPRRLPSEPIEINTHNYLDNLMPDAEEPELTELELEILRAFVPGTGNQQGLFYRLLDAEYEAASDAIVSLQGQGHISFEGHSMDSGIYRLRFSGYPLRRRAMANSGTIEETPVPPPAPIQSGQRRLRNRNKK